jgi:hypothetical protein
MEDGVPEHVPGKFPGGTLTVTAIGQLFKVGPQASEVGKFLRESEEVVEAFKEHVWQFEHAYVSGGWTSGE